MKTLNKILDIIAIIIVIAAIALMAIFLYYTYMILDIFVDFQWWEFLIPLGLAAFAIWRIIRW